MNEKDHVTEELKALLEVYDFNINTLSGYLQLPTEKIQRLSNGEIDVLPKEPMYRFELFNKISFLYLSATEDKDRKLGAFLEVLISYHGMSEKSIAKMAGVEITDVKKLLSNSPGKVAEGSKFKIAVTVMALRFFLKDCEPKA